MKNIAKCEATDRIVALETLLGDVVKELREVCGEMPDHWVQFDVGYLRNLAKRLEQFTGGEVQKSTNTPPGRGCRCNSDLRPHYVATIAAGLASHPSYWVAGDLITSRIAEDAFDLADALMSTNRGKQP